jgi:uncharacterized membrane protein
MQMAANSMEQSLLLAQEAPVMDGMYWLLVTSRVLHILGAIILLGGLFYVRTVVTPAIVAGTAPPPDALFGGRRGKWAMLVGIATLLLLASGIFNYLYIINAFEKMAGRYHMLAGIKILLSLALFLLAALVAGRSAAAEGIRRNMRYWLGVCLALGIAIIILGAVLRTYERIPKRAAVEREVVWTGAVR